MPDDSYMAEGTPLIFAKATGNPKVDQVRATAECLRQIERFIQQHPEQWHVPHRIFSGSP
jgi:lauroyl/myristoyl acyltransferase